MILVAGLTAAGITGAIPFRRVGLIAPVFLSGTAAVVIAVRSTQRYLLTLGHPRHLSEIARALQTFRVADESGFMTDRCDLPGIRRTSQGIAISLGTVRQGTEIIRHYAFSSLRQALDRRAARFLAKTLLMLDQSTGKGELIEGQHGVFHLLVNQSEAGSDREFGHGRMNSVFFTVEAATAGQQFTSTGR